MATAGPDGAYLVVSPHIAGGCLRGSAECSALHAPAVIRRDSSGETGGPTLNAFGVVRTVSYRGRPSCHLPDGAEVQAAEQAQRSSFLRRLRTRYPEVYRRLYHDAHRIRGSQSTLPPREIQALQSVQLPAGYSPESPCPAVGYVPRRAHRFTHSELATALRIRIESAPSYCEKREHIEPCGPVAPAGFRRVPIQPDRHELLVLISFRTRIAITNYNRHYEIQTTAAKSAGNPRCLGDGGGAFAPSDSDFRVGQEVLSAEFISAECHGVYHVTVGLVSTDGPSGSMPVPGLPGQSAEVPVGEGNFKIP